MSTKITPIDLINEAIEFTIESKVTQRSAMDCNEFTDRITSFIETLKVKKVCPIVPNSIHGKLLEMSEKLGDFLLLATAKKVNIKNQYIESEIKALHDDIQKIFKLLKSNWVFNPEDLNAWAELSPFLSRYTLTII